MVAVLLEAGHQADVYGLLVWPYSFYFHMVDCQSSMRKQTGQAPLPDLSALFLGLVDAVCSLMFPNKPLRSSQNYVECKTFIMFTF